MTTYKFINISYLIYVFFRKFEIPNQYNFIYIQTNEIRSSYTLYRFTKYCKRKLTLFTDTTFFVNKISRPRVPCNQNKVHFRKIEKYRLNYQTLTDLLYGMCLHGPCPIHETRALVQIYILDKKYLFSVLGPKEDESVGLRYYLRSPLMSIYGLVICKFTKVTKSDGTHRLG